MWVLGESISMADRYEDLLSQNNSKVVKNRRGTQVECYKNEKRGLMFTTKEDFERYMRHVLLHREILTGKSSCVCNNELEKQEEDAVGSADAKNPDETQEAHDAERVMSGQFAGPGLSAKEWGDSAVGSKAARREFRSRKK